MVQVDDTTAVAYLNNMGGSRSVACNQITHEVWGWCINIITAASIPGQDNVESDRQSRCFADNLEWSLDVKVFAIIWEVFLPFYLGSFCIQTKPVSQ